MIDIYSYYICNNEFRTFVDDFAKKHRTTFECALKCIEVKERYQSLIKGIMPI